LAIKEAAARHLLEKPQQYSPAAGIPELRAVIAQHSALYCGLPVDADNGGVVVTAGATEALSAAILAFGEEMFFLSHFFAVEKKTLSLFTQPGGPRAGFWSLHSPPVHYCQSLC
jgi:aspartate/methionine/tyrosine aminotransferase